MIWSLALKREKREWTRYVDAFVRESSKRTSSKKRSTPNQGRGGVHLFKLVQKCTANSRRSDRNCSRTCWVSSNPPARLPPARARRRHRRAVAEERIRHCFRLLLRFLLIGIRARWIFRSMLFTRFVHYYATRKRDCGRARCGASPGRCGKRG